MNNTGVRRLVAGVALLLVGGAGGWFLALRFGVPDPPAPPADGTVEGVCTVHVHLGPAGAGVASRPIPGARVQVVKAGGSQRYTEVIADDAGRFAVRLPPGRYELRMTAPVAGDVPVPVEVEPGKTRPVELTVNEFQV